MLILTRKQNESILLNPGTDDEIEVRVLGVKGRQVRIGIEAPDEVEIHRDEVYDRIKTERELEKAG